jgi:hypothetical protein
VRGRRIAAALRAAQKAMRVISVDLISDTRDSERTGTSEVDTFVRALEAAQERLGLAINSWNLTAMGPAIRATAQALRDVERHLEGTGLNRDQRESLRRLAREQFNSLRALRERDPRAHSRFIDDFS